MEYRQENQQGGARMTIIFIFDNSPHTHTYTHVHTHTRTPRTLCATLVSGDLSKFPKCQQPPVAQQQDDKKMCESIFMKFTSSERNYDYHLWRPGFIYFQTEVKNNQIKCAQKRTDS